MAWIYDGKRLSSITEGVVITIEADPWRERWKLVRNSPSEREVILAEFSDEDEAEDALIELAAELGATFIGAEEEAATAEEEEEEEEAKE